MGAALLAAMAACTLALTFVAALEPALHAWLVIALGALALEAVQRVALLRSPRSVRRFTMQRGGAIEVESASGERVSGTLRPGSFVAPWMVIVRWRRPGALADSTVLVLPGMAPAEDLRRLRVLLRWP